MKVLVTGGAGFIGSHVVEELLNHQFEVIVVDNFVTGSLNNLYKDIRHYQMDINDPTMETVFSKEKPDFVIHLAAQASVITSLSEPYLDFNTNTAGTVKILLLANQFNVKKIVFSSTAAVYGEPLYLPIDENHPVNPESFYALSKNAAENYLRVNAMLNGVEHCILRFSNVYGPKQNVLGEAGVVSIFTNQLVCGNQVSIFDGSQTRDFVYVKDVAVACRLALKEQLTGVFNISSGTETTINDLLDRTAKELGVKANPTYKPARMGEIKHSVLENKKAISEMDWNVNYSLTQGLKETVQYYLEHSNKKS